MLRSFRILSNNNYYVWFLDSKYDFVLLQEASDFKHLGRSETPSRFRITSTPESSDPERQLTRVYHERIPHLGQWFPAVLGLKSKGLPKTFVNF